MKWNQIIKSTWLGALSAGVTNLSRRLSWTRKPSSAFVPNVGSPPSTKNSNKKVYAVRSKRTRNGWKRKRLRQLAHESRRINFQRGV